MDWNPAYIWLVIALLLGLAELASGVLVLLSLGIAAVLTSGLAFIGMTFLWQLLGFSIFSGILLPLTIKVIQPYFSPKELANDTADAEEEKQTYQTYKRTYDGTTLIQIDGDDYCIRVAGTLSTQLPAGSWVIFQEFERDVAIVTLPPPK